MLEETKREVRDIRAIESQLRWNMQREEKRERIAEVKTEIAQMRDWRWKQEDEMKAYRGAKDHEEKVTELKESKAFQEFKRNIKAQGRLEERRLYEEILAQDCENARVRRELAQENRERDKDVQFDRIEDRLEIREIRHFEKVLEKREVDENRALEQTLQMAALAKAVADEKEQILQSLEHSRAACQRSPQRNAYPPSPTLGHLS